MHDYWATHGQFCALCFGFICGVGFVAFGMEISLNCSSETKAYRIQTKTKSDQLSQMDYSEFHSSI